MINQDFFLALEDLEKEKGISQAEFISALENALVIAYKKRYAVSVKIIKNAKLNAENNAIYLPALPGLCEVYSRKVIKLASEEIKVPTPPIFTPSNNSV